MKYPVALFILVCLTSSFVQAESGTSDPCDYVQSTHLLEDTLAVKECFNSYVLPDCVIEGITTQIDVGVNMYPYTDIAKNPPTYPSQEYYGKVDTDQALDELDDALEHSDNIVSNVFRALEKFVTGYRDGHFYINVQNTPQSKNIFARVIYSLPFGWNYLPDDQGNFHVYVFSSQTGKRYNLGNQTYLDEIYSKGVYAETVDGEPAFDYFKDFLGIYNDMRATQARLHYARMNSIDGTSMLAYPPEDEAFDEHAMVLSNGDVYKFNMTFLNGRAPPIPPTRTESSSYPRRQRGVSVDSEIRTLEILRNHQPNILSDLSKNKYALCSVKKDVNYISIPSFTCGGDGCTTVFEDEIVSCITEFDKNTNPIVVNFPGNLGGQIVLTTLIGGLLNPSGDSEYVQATRKTDLTKVLVQRGFPFASNLADDQCTDFIRNGNEFEEFWKNSETDDYGNGVIHERTQLLSSYNKAVQKKIETYRLKKNPRKPTDIIVVTDSICFSSCSIFVNNAIEKGSAIVTGVGGYNPGDELFVASQNPTQVLSLHSSFPNLEPYVEESGVSFDLSFMETFPAIRGDSKLIPRDYTLSYIDKHLGVYPVVTHTTTEYDDETVELLIQKALAVREEFQESCNPNNPSLFFVTDECTSSDEHAVFVGYPCGSNGKWNKTNCLISSCEYGYHVDFDNNKCVPYHCVMRADDVSSSERKMVNFVVVVIAFALLVL